MITLETIGWISTYLNINLEELNITETKGREMVQNKCGNNWLCTKKPRIQSRKLEFSIYKTELFA